MADVIRVLVVDDDPLVRTGLSLVLGAGEEIRIVGEASDGAAAVADARRLRPDVILMDIRMPGTDGLTAIEAIRSGGGGPGPGRHEPGRPGPGRPEPGGCDAAIIVLTTFDTDEYILRALRLGANGFLLKDTPPGEILAAVRRVAAGESMLSPTVLSRLIGYVTRYPADGAPPRATDQRELAGRAARARQALDRLTDRELEVAEAVAAGRSNAEISAELYMSVATAKAYVSRILTKLGCTNRVQIAILVHEARGVTACWSAGRPAGG